MRGIQPGVYVLTHHDDCTDHTLLRDVEKVLSAGAAMIQYRDKSGNPQRRLRQAHQLQSLCRQYQVPLIINDDLDLCESVGADGLHLGRQDGDLPTARQRLGPEVMIGASCYNDLSLATTAASQGANYIAFGSVFPSSTKPDAVHAPLALLEQARTAFDLPICAIGGIAAANIDRVASAGAHLAAVISSVWEGDPVANMQRLNAAFKQGLGG